MAETALSRPDAPRARLAPAAVPVGVLLLVLLPLLLLPLAANLL